MNDVPHVHHPIFARFYERFAARREGTEIRDRRRAVLEGLSGRVLDLGAGTGVNFGLFGDGVREVVAVEPEVRLRRAAQAAAGSASVPVEVRDGVGERIPAADGEFDAAVATLVLCSVQDQERTLQELHRVVRPGGELRFYEHVAASSSAGRAVQRGLDRTVWPLLAGGCHMSRDTVAAIARSGFEVQDVRSVRFVAPQPPLPFVLGSARRR